MGAEIEVRVIDTHNFAWTIVRSMPEQPLLARLKGPFEP
jgi:hypothetical protein